MGIGLDYGGFGFELIPSADMTEVLSAFPRLKMKERFAETCCRLVTAKPETSSEVFCAISASASCPATGHYRPSIC
jgi:hypothetical protein